MIEFNIEVIQDICWYKGFGDIKYLIEHGLLAEGTNGVYTNDKLNSNTQERNTLRKIKDVRDFAKVKTIIDTRLDTKNVAIYNRDHVVQMIKDGIVPEGYMFTYTGETITKYDGSADIKLLIAWGIYPDGSNDEYL